MRGFAQTRHGIDRAGQRGVGGRDFANGDEAFARCEPFSAKATDDPVHAAGFGLFQRGSGLRSRRPRHHQTATGREIVGRMIAHGLAYERTKRGDHVAAYDAARN